MDRNALYFKPVYWSWWALSQLEKIVAFFEDQQYNEILGSEKKHSFFAKEVSCLRAKYLEFTSICMTVMLLCSHFLETWKVKNLLNEPTNLNLNIEDIASFVNLYAASVTFSLQYNGHFRFFVIILPVAFTTWSLLCKILKL